MYMPSASALQIINWHLFTISDRKSNKSKEVPYIILFENGGNVTHYKSVGLTWW